MLNRLCLVGRLTKDPEFSKTAQGVPCVRFFIAHDTFSKSGRRSEFFKCVGYSGVAEICEKYVKKGMLVSISGQIYQAIYEKKDGTRGESIGIRVAEIDILSKFKKNDGEEAEAMQEEEPKAKDIVPDELPF